MPAKHHILQHLLTLFPSNIFIGFTASINGSDMSSIMSQQDMESASIHQKPLWPSFIDAITTYILTIPIEYQPKRGDTIGIHPANYTTIPPTSVVFWNGNQAIDRHYSSFTKDGGVPLCFNVLEEMMPDHWSNIVRTTDVVPVRQGLLNGYKLLCEPEFATDKGKDYLRVQVLLGRYECLVYMRLQDKTKWSLELNTRIGSSGTVCYRHIRTIIWVEYLFDTIIESILYVTIGLPIQ
jgi:hypothetical protein